MVISNNGALPSIRVGDAGVLSSIPIKDADGKIINSTGLLFKISLDAPSNQTVRVDYATADGTAIAESDYDAKDKTLTFQPGETEKQVFVGVTLDEISEDDEHLYLNLTNPINATIADNQAVGTIEETRSLSVSDLEVSEDGTAAIFTVSLDQPSVHGVFVTYDTEDGTAKAGADYIKTSGRLFIKAGEANGTVSVPLINNNLTEDNETFFLNLSQPKYVFVDDEQGQAIILNDDPLLTENPGGIHEGLQLWLKGDAGITSNNGQIVSWEDNSQVQLNVGQDTAESRPNIDTELLNYNPVLSFDGDDLLETADTLPEDFVQNSSVFVVTKSNSNSNNFLFTLDNTGWGRFLAHMPWGNNIHFDAGGTGDGRLSIPYSNSGATEFSTWHFSSETDVGQNIFHNGLSVASDSNTQNPITKNRKFQLGRQYDGEIAEVIVYNQALGKSDRLAVDSYLGIKYGLTLDQTVATNYINSDGLVWWDAIQATEYKNDVAGIAKDHNSGLAQVKSRSSNANSIITIKAEDTVNGLEDGEALVWGNKDRTVSKNTLKLDGTNDYLKIPDSDAIDFSKDQDFTIEVQVKTDGSTANDAIVEKWGQSGGYPFIIRYKSNGTIIAARFDRSNSPHLTSSTKINDGEFHHIAFVKSGDQLQLYIDGKLESTATDTTTGITTNTSPLYLGSRGGNNEFFNGNLKDFRIWSVARTAAEIQTSQDYVDPNSDGLVAYLPLESDANDITNNGNHGTFHNGASIEPIEAIDLSKRIWQVQEKQGDVGTVSVSFDLTELGQQLPIENYALQIASEQTFSDAISFIHGRQLEDSTLTFTGINFKDGEYFTLDTEVDHPPNTLKNTTEIYVNAGAHDFVDSNGRQWLQGEGFSSVKTFTSSQAISNTEDDALYQSEYFGQKFSYTQAVENGNYDVTLKFAEIYFNQEGKRVFDVALEDQLILDDFDLVAEAGGKNRALDRTFTVQVNDGVIDLDFLASVNQAKISGIEIQPASPVTHINAGGNSYTDLSGQQWLQGEGFSPVKTFTSSQAIANTEDDTLYQSEYFGQNFSYTQAVENGNYDITLKFAEIYFNQAGKRVFDVVLEDQLILDDFDLVAEAGGKNIALDRTFTVQVNDGVIDLDFLASVNQAKISGIEIEQNFTIEF